MGQSLNVVGVRKADEHWKKLKAVYDACVVAHIDPPDEVERFFNWRRPRDDEEEQEVDIRFSVKQWQGDNATGYEIDLEKIPVGIRILRVYNSW